MKRVLLVGFLGLAACAGDSVNAPDDHDLIGGAKADDTYLAVGALRDETGTPFCTATLVAPRFVITAQHCLEGGSEDMPEDHDPAKTTFATGANAKRPGQTVALKAWYPVPDFAHPESELRASDVMLAELAEPLAGVTPFAIDPATLAVGESLEVLGFGVRAANGIGASGGKREVGSMKVVATGGNAFETQYGSRAAFDAALAKLDPEAAADGVGDRFWPRADLHAGYEVLAYGARAETCYGDSGGPLLRVVDGKRTVVGVVSEGFNVYASSCLHLGTVFAVFGPETRALFAKTL